MEIHNEINEKIIIKQSLPCHITNTCPHPHMGTAQTCIREMKSGIPQLHSMPHNIIYGHIDIAALLKYKHQAFLISSRTTPSAMPAGNYRDHGNPSASESTKGNLPSPFSSSPHIFFPFPLACVCDPSIHFFPWFFI